MAKQKHTRVVLKKVFVYYLIPEDLETDFDNDVFNVNLEHDEFNNKWNKYYIENVDFTNIFMIVQG